MAATPCDPGTGIIPVPHETAGPPFYSNRQVASALLREKLTSEVGAIGDALSKKRAPALIINELSQVPRSSVAKQSVKKTLR